MPKNNGYDPYMGRPDDWEDQLEKDIAFFDEFAKRIKNSFEERNKDNVYMINPKVAKKMEFVASEMYELCGGKWAEDDGALKIEFDFSSDPFKIQAGVIVKAFDFSIGSENKERFQRLVNLASTVRIEGLNPQEDDCSMQMEFYFVNAFITPSDIK